MSRIPVLKTYKIFVGGKFPRTESGRFYTPVNAQQEKLANVCLCSRKDFRDAVLAARSAFGGWSNRAAFNRGQILYRIAEMLEGRKAQFVEELIQQSYSRADAVQEVEISIDRLIYYAGWCDKFQQVFSSVNPVASSHFNFSVPEATGVTCIVAAENSGLLGLVSLIAPAIAGGNTVIVLASYTKPLCAVTFAEVVHSSDVPGGVVNILTGKATELAPYFAEHMDVNALWVEAPDVATKKMLQTKAAQNMKRLKFYDKIDWLSEAGQSPYFILDAQEIKTTWHPVENIGGAKAGY